MDDAAAPTTPPPPQSAPPVLSPVSDGEGRKEERDPLALPSPEVLKEIARRQELRAKEIRAKRAAALAHGRGQHAAATAVAAGGAGAGDDAQARDAAAALIQKNYRGYRERRAMSGWGLDPSTRWMEALKEGENTVSRRLQHGLGLMYSLLQPSTATLRDRSRGGSLYLSGRMAR
ncbi:hypothetical protein K431DRAFT_103262 [Polychaeton citri CBS 116435]|uniref:Uncharacterized protein n=1 Tax=Polychaeton citri CBS 116435 TaxID=1314669 RepID=A0A9P4UNY2_9PEZI|nr:hypothetical protein K431DRAFT_103262 [Polychaeton citri CBS 116435]